MPIPSFAPRSGLVAIALAGLAAAPAALAAQGAGADSVTVVPGAQYRAGGLHRFFFGTRYRELWTTPIRVPVLDLTRYAGGLTPTERGGGQQTKSLRFRGGDGREYQFRSLEKDPTGVLPPELRETFAVNLLRDQMSSGHPAGALVVAPLLEAAGVLHATPILVQLPDHPRLGDFRAEFGGLVGTVEERPRELEGGLTFAGAREVASSDELYERLDRNPAARVDSRGYLLARLTDLFVGDWDRHRDQWRWALIERGGARSWQPIPRDRDQAFVRFDGFMLNEARRQAPQLLNFGPRYGDVVGATWNGRDLDRRFLSDLDRAAWDSVARTLQGRLTDAAIQNAVSRLPREYQPLDGERLASALRSRRDGLPEMAARWYRLLADRVDIYGTDRNDEAVVTRSADGTLVTLTAEGATYFRRRFERGETGEIRIHLMGGADRLQVTGDGPGSPLVRVIGGGGNDRYEVSGGGIKLYDDRGENTAAGAGINRKEWAPPRDTAVPNPVPPRDWGRKTLTVPMLYFAPDLGLVGGYAGFTRWFGFRHLPAAVRADYGLLYSTGEKAFRADLGLTSYNENSKGMWEITALASGIETLRWYGFGNATSAVGETEFHRLNQNIFGLGLGFGTRIGDRGRFMVGPTAKWSDTDLSHRNNRDRFIADDAPYGTGEFGMVGGRAQLVLDNRDHPKMATSGARLVLEATAFPEAWDVDRAFGALKGEASVALAPNGRWRPSLNLMAGGVWMWGDSIPFFEAAYLGGSRTLRGYRPNRFAGERSAYGSAELRLPLTRIKFVVPGEQGLFGFGDAGRVWVDNETGPDADDIHTSFGGGVWFAFLNRDNVLVVGAGVPSERIGTDKGTRVFVSFGFPF